MRRISEVFDTPPRGLDLKARVLCKSRKLSGNIKICHEALPQLEVISFLSIPGPHHTCLHAQVFLGVLLVPSISLC